jgi:hypothetical protein
VKLSLFVVLAMVSGLVGCKEKPKATEPPAAPARTAPPVGAEPPRAPSPELPPPPPPAIDAGDVIDAPPTKSELAVAARAEFFSKVGKTSKRGAGDCGALLAELEGFAGEARAMAQRRTEVTGAEVARDDALVSTTLRAMTRITSACPEKDRFDAFLNILGEVPR